MSEPDISNTKLAYTIIQSLLQANEAVSDLLVVMSHALDQETVKALTNTNEWEAYMESKRELETTKVQIEKFTEELKKMENGKWKMENGEQEKAEKLTED